MTWPVTRQALRCALAQVVTHPKGHVIPQLQGADLQRVRAFLEAQREVAKL